MSDAKFRSIKAFKSFEEGTLADADERPVATISPLRVLGAVKSHPHGVKRAELLLELDAPATAVDAALLRLMKENLVVSRKGTDSADVFVAA